MILSKDIPAANCWHMSSLTDFGIGKCLNSLCSTVWLVWVEIYFTSTVPSARHFITIILAMQQFCSLRLGRAFRVLPVLLGPECPRLLPSLQHVYIILRLLPVEHLCSNLISSFVLCYIYLPLLLTTSPLGLTKYAYVNFSSSSFHDINESKFENDFCSIPAQLPHACVSTYACIYVRRALPCSFLQCVTSAVA